MCSCSCLLVPQTRAEPGLSQASVRETRRNTSWGGAGAFQSDNAPGASDHYPLPYSADIWWTASAGRAVAEKAAARDIKPNWCVSEVVLHEQSVGSVPRHSPLTMLADVHFRAVAALASFMAELPPVAKVAETPVRQQCPGVFIPEQQNASANVASAACVLRQFCGPHRSSRRSSSGQMLRLLVRPMVSGFTVRSMARSFWACTPTRTRQHGV